MRMRRKYALCLSSICCSDFSASFFLFLGIFLLSENIIFNTLSNHEYITKMYENKDYIAVNVFDDSVRKRSLKRVKYLEK